VKVRELMAELAGMRPDLEVYIPNSDPLDEPAPINQWEYIYEEHDYEGREEPTGVLFEAHPWWRHGR
jgi:hypothetical protein